jgi:hypothetical protein
MTTLGCEHPTLKDALKCFGISIHHNPDCSKCEHETKVRHKEPVYLCLACEFLETNDIRPKEGVKSKCTHPDMPDHPKNHEAYFCHFLNSNAKTVIIKLIDVIASFRDDDYFKIRECISEHEGVKKSVATYGHTLGTKGAIRGDDET